MNEHPSFTSRVWPAGTMIILNKAFLPEDGGHPRPEGACGVILDSPEEALGAYRVRFPDGGAYRVPAHALGVLKHYQKGEIGNSDVIAQSHDLYAHVIFKVMVGSRAYGLDGEGSDTDWRGIYLPPADLHWSIYGVPEQLEPPDVDECYWELGKFVRLALKANPNVLECLYSPHIEIANEVAQDLLSIRQSFISKMIYQTYNRYVMSQFKVMQRSRERGTGFRTKHAMHLIRLLLSGLSILEHGEVPLLVQAHREALLEIKHGEMNWEEIDAWRLRIHQDFDRAFEASSLPQRPDYHAINAFVVRARRWATSQKYD